MIDTLRKNVTLTYRKLCSKLKISNWQKEVFMSNSIEIMADLEKRVSELEIKLKEIKK